MATPTREQIREKATEIFMQEQHRHGIGTNLPELCELREEGYLETAKTELMSNQYEKQWRNYSEQTGFSFDTTEAMTTTTFISGSRGTGKSDTAMYAVDRLKNEGIVCVGFDSSLDWIRRSSISRYVTVQPYSIIEVPTESTIFDISLLSPLEQQRTVESFCKKLFEFQLNNNKRYYLIFEESQLYFPLNSIRAKRFQNSARVLTVGRNVRISLCAISQFPALIDKELIKNAQQIYIGCTAEPNTLNYWRGILGKKQTKKLKTLQNGQFLYYCRNKIDQIQVQPYENSTTKKQITVTESEPIEPLPKTQANYASLKTAVVGFLGLIILWSMIH